MSTSCNIFWRCSGADLSTRLWAMKPPLCKTSDKPHFTRPPLEGFLRKRLKIARGLATLFPVHLQGAKEQKVQTQTLNFHKVSGQSKDAWLRCDVELKTGPAVEKTKLYTDVEMRRISVILSFCSVCPGKHIILLQRIHLCFFKTTHMKHFSLGQPAIHTWKVTSQ